MPVASRTSVSPWPKPEERERERVMKREAVLRMAVKSFNEKGFHATSLDDVAAQLNVTKPTIYHYFANKDDILFECVRRGLEGISEAAEAVERNCGSGLERLKALMRDYALIMTRDFGMCVTRTADHELSVESRALFRQLKRQIDMTVRTVIEDGIRDGSIRAGDVRLMTFTIAGALNWIARWYDADGEMLPETIADGCIDIIVGGIAAQPPGHAVRKIGEAR
ncbi:TetR/AcrR family transcriptional regulator [Mesorhizobium sp. ASY16-5R]|uniref:TetR/AcrR family transcriptional regulator n=1 Tax=Mesorhizobium sp. ASY16-5R TaxID=3445772 RepID=UPI003FA0C449